MSHPQKPGIRYFLVFFFLYAAQAIPITFFSVAVPPILREGGVSLEKIGMFSILTLIVIFKSVIAPIIERLDGGPFGPLKTWIYGAQLLTVLATVAMGFIDPVNQVDQLFLAAAVWMFFANTQDVGLDALSVRTFFQDQHSAIATLGFFAVQAATILAGFFIVQLVLRYNFQVGVTLVTIFLLFPFFLLMTIKEPRIKQDKPKSRMPTVSDYLTTFKNPGMPRYLTAAFFLTVGWGLTNPMIDPLLVDRGFNLEQFAWINGLVVPISAVLGVLMMPILFKLFSIVFLIRFSLVILILNALLFLLAVFGPVDLWLIVAFKSVGSVAGTFLLVTLASVTLSLARPSRAAVDLATMGTIPAFASAISGTASGFIAGAAGYPVLFVGAFVIKVIGALTITVNLDLREYFSKEEQPVIDGPDEALPEPSSG